MKGRQESSFETEDIVLKEEPGSTYSKNGEAFTILEDGSISAMRDSSYRDFMKMLSDNKIYTYSDLKKGVPKFNTNVLVEGNVDDLPFYSVHDIITEVDYSSTGDQIAVVKKRLSFASFGKDIFVSDKWRTKPDGSTNNTVNMTDLFNDIMTASFTLDEYFDKNKSNTALLMRDGVSVSSVRIRLRKIDNPVSVTDETEFINVLMTGKAALEVLNKLKTDINALRTYSSVNIENSYNDGTADTSVVNFKSNHDTLVFVIDSYNNDLSSEVDIASNTITFKHREFGVLSSDNTPSPNSTTKQINMTKSLVMNSNGHLVAVTKTDVEITKEINYLYYNRDQIDVMLLDKNTSDTQIVQGDMDIDSLTVRGNASFKDGYEVSGDTIVLNSVNTSVKDPIITIGSDNTDNSAQNVGVVYNVYKSAETWDDNVLTGSTVSYAGGTVGLNGTTWSGIFSSEVMSKYKPADLENDALFDSSYYVSDTFLSLKSSKINMLLALFNVDDVQKSTNNLYKAKCKLFLNNVTNTKASDVKASLTVFYKRINDVENIVMSEPIQFTYQDTNMKTLNIINTYDIDTITVRIRVGIKSTVFEALSGKSVGLNIQQLGIYGVSSLTENLLTSTDSPFYVKRYYTQDTLATFSYVNVTSNDVKQKFTNIKEMVVPTFEVDVTDKNTIDVNGVDRKYAYMEVSIPETNLLSTDSITKIMKIKGTFTPTYKEGETSDIIDYRKKYSITPSMKNYKVVVDTYATLWSKLISRVGSETETKDQYGKSVITRVESIVDEFIPIDTDLVQSDTLVLDHYSTYANIDATIELNLSKFVGSLNNKVEYFSGMFKNDKIVLYTVVNVIQVPLNEIYSNYTDKIECTKVELDLFDVVSEQRGTARDVVVNTDIYDEIPSMFKTSEWDSIGNVLENSSFLVNNGITRLENKDDVIKIYMNKSAGVNYSALGWTDIPDNYDQRVYMFSYRFSKESYNLLKIMLKLSSIASNDVSLDSFDNVKLWSSLFVYNKDGTYTSVPKYISSELDDNTDVGDVQSIIPKSSKDGGTKSIAEVQRMCNFVTKNTPSVYTLFKPGVLNRMYFDVNSVPDNSMMELDVLIDIPVNSKQNIQTILALFDIMCVRGIINMSYKTRYTDELSQSQDMVYHKDTNAIRFMENKFSSSNKEENVSHLTNIEANNLIGEVSSVGGFKNDLEVSLIGDVTGSFTISETNKSIKNVKTRVEEGSSDVFGVVGILPEYDPNAASIPDYSVYNTASIYEKVKFMDAYMNRREHGLENNDPSYLASARSLKALYTYAMYTIEKVGAKWKEESEARRIANTHYLDLLGANPNGLNLESDSTIVTGGLLSIIPTTFSGSGVTYSYSTITGNVVNGSTDAWTTSAYTSVEQAKAALTELNPPYGASKFGAGCDRTLQYELLAFERVGSNINIIKRTYKQSYAAKSWGDWVFNSTVTGGSSWHIYTSVSKNITTLLSSTLAYTIPAGNFKLGIPYKTLSLWQAGSNTSKKGSSSGYSPLTNLLSPENVNVKGKMNRVSYQVTIPGRGTVSGYIKYYPNLSDSATAWREAVDDMVGDFFYSERRDGDSIYNSNAGVFNGIGRLSGSANNDANGSWYDYGTDVIFDSINIGQLKQLYLPNFNLTNFVEYLYGYNPRWYSFVNQVNYVGTNYSYVDDFRNGYGVNGLSFGRWWDGSWHTDAVEEDRLQFPNFKMTRTGVRTDDAMYFLHAYTGGRPDGGGYDSLHLNTPCETYFRLRIQYLNSSGVWVDAGSSWDTGWVEYGNGARARSFRGISTLQCSPTTRYRVIKSVKHHRLDIDMDYAADSRGGTYKRRELRGGFLHTRWSGVITRPYVTDGDKACPWTNLYLFTKFEIKYVTWYNEPWEDQQECLTGNGVAIEGFKMNYNIKSNSYIIPKSVDDAHYVADSSTVSGLEDTVARSNLHVLKFDSYVDPDNLRVIKSKTSTGVSYVLKDEATEYMKRMYTPVQYTEYNDAIFYDDNKYVGLFNMMQTKEYYVFGSGSYWLSDGFCQLPKNITKLKTISSQQLNDILLDVSKYTGVTSGFVINIQLKRWGQPPTSAQEAADNGTVLVNWNINVRDSDIGNTSGLSGLDQDYTTNSNFYYYYYIKYGKDSTFSMLNSTEGIINVSENTAEDSYDIRPLYFTCKYYVLI